MPVVLSSLPLVWALFPPLFQVVRDTHSNKTCPHEVTVLAPHAYDSPDLDAEWRRLLFLHLPDHLVTGKMKLPTLT